MSSSKLVKLSDGVYHFPECFNRFEEYVHFLHNGDRSPYKAALYNKTTQITIVKETVEEILEKLNNE
jgi:hypothetical protein